MAAQSERCDRSIGAERLRDRYAEKALKLDGLQARRLHRKSGAEEGYEGSHKKGDDPSIREEYKADMEELMNDLFSLIKQNEELKEEIERLRGENVNLQENSRSVVTELSNTIEEKAAEIEHQKHELRRLSSAVELDDVGVDIEKYKEVKEIKEEYEEKVCDLETSNSDLKQRLDAYLNEKEALSKHHAKMQKKLQMEREQNEELNKQIQVVSNLYDTYYAKCEELQKGRMKGLSVPLGVQITGPKLVTEKGRNLPDATDSIEEEEFDKGWLKVGGNEIKEETARGRTTSMLVQVGDHQNGLDMSGFEEETEMRLGDVGEDEKEVTLGTEEGVSGEEKGDAGAADAKSSQENTELHSQNVSIEGENNISSTPQTETKSPSSKERQIGEKLTEEAIENDQNCSSCWISDSFLLLITYIFRMLGLATATFMIIIVLREHFGMPFKYILSGLFASYVFLYNLWRIIAPKRGLQQTEPVDKKDGEIGRKLRRAMQDLITRLDENEFKQFSEIYEGFIKEQFGENKQPYSLKEEVKFLKASKNVLAAEVSKYKEKNHEIHVEYQKMKREVEMMRLKRLQEGEAKEKQIKTLKEELNVLAGKQKEGDSSIRIRNAGKSSKDSSATNKISYLKYGLLAILHFLFFLSVRDSLLLIPASLLSAILLSFIYKSDRENNLASSDIQGYKKTVEELLLKVEEYKKEGKQISNEIKELESVVDKDYEIISKQRHAIERLERQLQRAICKYTEKKRTLGKIVWLQEQGLGDFAGLDASATGEEILRELNGSGHGSKPQEPTKVADDSFEENVKTDHESAAKLDKEPKLKGSSRLQNAIFLITFIASVPLGYYGFLNWHNFVSIDHQNLIDMLPVAALAIAVLTILKYAFTSNKRRLNAEYELRLRELREDERMLREQVETLRHLLQTEREFILKLENVIDAGRESSIDKIPQSEVNSVIDRLIEVSKQRDELKVEADSSKNKYDNVKITLEDILNREKYLSEEVSSLRSQKRELQNDLMKEQIKHIDMYENLKEMGEHSKDTRKLADQSEDNITEFLPWNKELVHEVIEETQERNTFAEASLFEDNEDLFEKMEKQGREAQKSRKRRKGGKSSSNEAKSGSQKSKKIQETVEQIHLLGNEESFDDMEKLGPEKTESEIALQESAMNVSDAKSGTTKSDENEAVSPQTKESEDDSDRSLDLKERIPSQTDDMQGRADKVSDETHQRSDQTDGPSDQTKFDRLQQLLDAKDGQLRELRGLLDLTNSNPSPNTSELKESQELHSLRRKLDFEQGNFAEMEDELHKLSNEILRLKEICDGDVNIGKIDEAGVPPQGLVRYLIEHIGLFRYRISTDKATEIAKLNTLQEKAEELERQVANLQVDIEKEKTARNHVITEYEDEYERLENRLSEAYESIRKRLMEERVMRGQIMKQYESEIEDMQGKTAEILQDLRVQLKQERKEKEDAEYQAEMMMKKIETMELDLKMIEENGKAAKSDVELEALLNGKDAGKPGNTRGKPQTDAQRMKKLVDAETTKRTKTIREKLERTKKDVEECMNKLKNKEKVIDRLQKQESGYKRKINIQNKRMKDLEYEVRTDGTMERDVSEFEGIRNSKHGVIYKLATKNGSKKWENPSSMGLVQVTRSSAGYGNASDILEHKLVPCSTENLENSWFHIDFGHDITIVPESYSLCHGWLSSDACLRSWVFEGSVDGNQWHTIRKHSMDTCLNDSFRTNDSLFLLVDGLRLLIAGLRLLVDHLQRKERPSVNIRSREVTHIS
eukprot:Seg2286.3 transcript_id=Seg2286.3/GoldUCD/mRNA.D3Y31 product="hypothetical protein" protein_id=Seg2286.3/GoldUCD/D3Y31